MSASQPPFTYPGVEIKRAAIMPVAIRRRTRQRNGHIRCSAARVEVSMVLALFSFPGSTVGLGIIIALVLAAVLWGPYLWKEIRKGKVELGPQLPSGTSEPHPGRR